MWKYLYRCLTNQGIGCIILSKMTSLFAKGKTVWQKMKRKWFSQVYSPQET